MRIFKKIMITALLMTLCFMMMLSSASAHNFTDVTRYEDAIGLLSTLEVIKGYSETRFGPEDEVTRWQMALLISKLVTGNVETSTWEAADNSSSFTDVKSNHYFGSIAYAHRNGIIIGRSEEIFAPEEPITLQDGLTMVVRALGYPSATLNAGYPDSYIDKGKELGLLTDISNLGYTANMTRGHTAQLLYNALYAETYAGTKLVESVFEIVERTIVLTATENMKINTNVSYAKSNTLIFSQLDAYGRLTDAFAIDASLFDLKSPNEYLGVAYKIVSTNDFSVVLELEQVSKFVLEAKTLNMTVTENSKTISIGEGVYEPVAGYRTYKIEKGVVPTGTKEIIIYGMNDVYKTQGTVITANEIAGTTAYYKMTAFDDNDDGFMDRALYFPYSFGQYIVDSSNKIAIAGNEPTSALTFTGVAPRHEDYVIYSYNPQSKTLDVLKIIAPKEDKVNYAEYTSTQGTLKIGEVIYNIGRKDLHGVTDKSDLEKVLLGVVAGTMQGRKIEFVADDNYIYWYKLGEVESNLSTSNIYGINIGVLTAVPQYNASYGYYTINISTNNSHSAALAVTMVDGAAVTSSGTALAKGDMVQYEVNTVISGTTTYKLTKINTAPTYNTARSTSKMYVNNSSVLSVEENGVIVKNFILAPLTPIYFLDANMNCAPYTSTTFGEKELSTYYSVYISNDATNSVSAVYIKPFDANSVVSSGEFNKIVYISKASIDAVAVNGINYRRYAALDLMTGVNIDVDLSYSTVPGVTSLTAAGYYRVYNNIITNIYPITETAISSSSIIVSNTVTISNITNVTGSYVFSAGNANFSVNTANIYFYVQEGSAIDGYYLTKYAVDSAQFLSYITNISTRSVNIIYTKDNYYNGTYYGPIAIIVK